VLLIAILFFAIVAPGFLSFYPLSNILTFASVLGIVVVGVAFLMISGEFDLSVGSIFTVAGYVFLIGLVNGLPPVIAMVGALLVSATLGVINGLIVIRLGIPSFIATLGTMLAYYGIARALGPAGPSSYVPGVKPLLFDILNGYIVPINALTEPAGNLRVASVWFIGAAVVMSMVLTRTRYGNWVFAVGGSPQAALAQGVPLKFVKLANFTLSGFFAGLASVILFAQRSSMNELLAGDLELTVVAAAVIGGVSLRGGIGSIAGAAMGMVLLSTVEQGLVLMGVPLEGFGMMVGAIIIVSGIVNKYVAGQD
jgi:simple sugar transport system permease protein